MPYIGRDLNRGNYLKLDDISSSFNSSTTTFNLTVGGSAFTPGSAFSILVSVGGVIQEPESAYQVNNSEITFANAPTAQDSFFCIALGVALGIGVPGNGTVNGAQIAKPFNYDGYFYLDDANNRVGIGSLQPKQALDIIGNTNITGILTAGTYSGPVSNASGISTFYDLKVTNNLTVEGTTTTLDTNLIGVDRIEVGANSNSVVGVAITQSGTADILKLYDSSTPVFVVKDGGKVGIGTDDLGALLDIGGNTDGNIQAIMTRGADQAFQIQFRNETSSNNAHTSAGKFGLFRNAVEIVGMEFLRGAGVGAGSLAFTNKDGETLRIESDGDVGIGTDTTGGARLRVYKDGTDTLLQQWRGSLGSTAGQRPLNLYSPATDTTSDYFRFDTGNALKFQIDSVDVLCIHDDRKVGIGTDNPQTTLEVVGAGVSVFNAAKNAGVDISGLGKIELIRSDSVAYIDFKTGSVEDFDCRIQQFDNGLRFYTGGQNSTDERLRIDSDGDVIIGSGGSWQYKKSLNVQGSSGSIISLYNADTTSYAADTTTGIELRLNTGNTGTTSASCEIRAFKENGTNGNSARALSFYTGVNGGSPTERLRITSGGQVNIAEGANPSSGGGKLNVKPSSPDSYFKIRNAADFDGTLTGNVIDNRNSANSASTDLIVRSDNLVLWQGTGGAEKVRIDSSGDVGIGTDNALARLDVYKGTSATDVDMFAVRSKTGAFNIQCSDTDAANPEWRLRTYANEDLVFSPGGTGSSGEKVRITSTGEVGIGTDNPLSALEVRNESGTNPLLTLSHSIHDVEGEVVRIGRTDNTIRYHSIKAMHGGAASNNYIGFHVHDGTSPYTNQTEVLRVRGDGNVGIGSTIPSAKLNVYTFPHSDTGGILVQNANYTANLDKPYLIAGTQTWTGAATDWSTYGFQHKLKSDGSGIPRLTIDGSAGGSNIKEVITFMASGKVGIGQNNPATTLEIKSDANAQTTGTIPTLRITNDDGSASVGDITGSVEFFTEDASDPNHVSGFIRNISETNAGVNYSLIFGTKDATITGDATEKLRIQSNGLVGIGTDSPGKKLHINTTGTSGEGILLKATDSTYPSFIGDANRSATDLFLVALQGYWNGNRVGEVTVESGSDTTNKDEGMVRIRTRTDGETSPQDRFTVHHTGQVEVHSTTQSTLTTNGALRVNGGIGVAKNIICGGALEVQNNTLTVTSGTPNILMAVPSGGLDSRIYNDGSGNFIIGHGTNSNTPTERLRITSAGQTIIKGFTGTGLKLEGSGSDYQGMQLQTTDSSASQTRNVFIDAVNETGAAVANQVGSVQADGGSAWIWQTQPTGDRTDRRVERLRITSEGNVDVKGGELGISTNTNNTSVLNFKNSVKDHKIGGVTVEAVNDTISDDIMLPGHRHGCLLMIFAHSDSTGTYPQPGPCGMVYVDVGASTNIRPMYTQSGISSDATTNVGNSIVGKSGHETDINNCDDGKLTVMKGSANGRIKLANRLDGTYIFYLTMM